MTAIRQFNNDEFRKGTFVVDPAGCGCTDCQLGYSTPEDELNSEQIVAAFLYDFEFVDRRGPFKGVDTPETIMLWSLRKVTN